MQIDDQFLNNTYLKFRNIKGIDISTDEIAVYRQFRKEFLDLIMEEIGEQILWRMFNLRKGTKFPKLEPEKEQRIFPEKVSELVLKDTYESFRINGISSDKVVVYSKYRDQFLRQLKERTTELLTGEDEDNCLWTLVRMRKSKKLKKLNES